MYVKTKESMAKRTYICKDFCFSSSNFACCSASACRWSTYAVMRMCAPLGHIASGMGVGGWGGGAYNHNNQQPHMHTYVCTQYVHNVCKYIHYTMVQHAIHNMYCILWGISRSFDA